MRKNKLSPLLRSDGLVRRKHGIHYALKMIDWMGWAVKWSYTQFRPKKKTPPMFHKRKTRILVVHFGGFGDGIMLSALFPALQRLSDSYVFDLHANKDVVQAVKDSTVFRNIFTSPDYFKKDYILKMKENINGFKRIGKSYDCAVVLRYGIDNGILPLYMAHITEKIAGFKTSGFSFCLDYVGKWDEFQHESENYSSVFRSCGIELGDLDIPYIHNDKKYRPTQYPYLVLHMGSKDHRRVLNSDAIQILVNLITNRTPMRLVLTGLESDKSVYNGVLITEDIIDYVGKHSFQEFVSTLLNASGVITVDTSAAHIAGSAVPVLEFFSGIVSPMQFHALGSDVEYPTVNVSCAPCYHPCKELECMRFDVEDVAKKWLIRHGFLSTGDTSSNT